MGDSSTLSRDKTSMPMTVGKMEVDLALKAIVWMAKAAGVSSSINDQLNVNGTAFIQTIVRSRSAVNLRVPTVVLVLQCISTGDIEVAAGMWE